MVAYALSPSLNPRLLVPGLAVLAGIGVAAGIATAPGATLDAVIGRSHLADILPQAAAPIGVTGRSLIALAVGGLVAALGLLATLIPVRPAPYRRRADAHPDAPVCRPLRPSEELDGALPIEAEETAEAPLLRRETPDAVTLVAVESPIAEDEDFVGALPIAPEPPVPPAVQELPADLNQPLSAFDPDAIPASPLEPVRAVAPLTRLAEVQMLPPLVAVASEQEPVAPAGDSKIVAFALAPERCSPDEEPRTIAPVETGEETIGALVARLERVAREAARTRRERAAKQPSLDDTLARLRQLAAG
jgi:hypothetical protein